MEMTVTKTGTKKKKSAATFFRIFFWDIFCENSSFGSVHQCVVNIETAAFFL